MDNCVLRNIVKETLRERTIPCLNYYGIELILVFLLNLQRQLAWGISWAFQILLKFWLVKGVGSGSALHHGPYWRAFYL